MPTDRIEELRALLELAPSQPWRCVGQRGEPGHCYLAQLFSSHGYSIAVLDAHEDADRATALARLMSDAVSNLPAPLDCAEMLDKLCTGLEWNIENHPEVMNQADEEALAEARAALARLNGDDHD